MIEASKNEDELIAQVAQEFEVPVETLTALLGLERDFPNMSVSRAKKKLAQRVEEVISAGLGPKD